MAHIDVQRLLEKVLQISQRRRMILTEGSAGGILLENQDLVVVFDG
jgi:hypothetical protein